MKQYTKTEFFEEFGRKGFIVKVNNNDVETGDYQLFCPEEQHIAKEWQDRGYVLASVFEMEEGEDIVVLDNDLGTSPFKIGYLVVENKSI